MGGSSKSTKRGGKAKKAGKAPPKKKAGKAPPKKKHGRHGGGSHGGTGIANAARKAASEAKTSGGKE